MHERPPEHAVAAFSGSLLRELVGYNIRVSDVCPGMVETEFSVTRFRGDADAAKKVYEGLQPLVAQDIAEEILWIASRPGELSSRSSLPSGLNVIGTLCLDGYGGWSS